MGNGRRAFLVLPVAILLAVTGCTVVRPEGASPLRYRDTVFTGVTVTSNIQYGSAPDADGNPQALTLDMYRPTGDTQTRRPALVWAHGGSFVSGDKTNTVPVAFGNQFAKQGYVVVSINYRLLAPPGCASNPSQLACTLAALEAKRDAQAAVRFLRANAGTYGIDPARIAVGGESAGGITATLAGLFSEDIGSSGNPGFPSTVGAFVSISGGVPNGLFASRGDAWGLFFHGTADNVVPIEWSAQTAAKMLAADVPAFFEAQEGAGHVPWAQHGAAYLQQADYFLYFALDLAHAAGQPPSVAKAAEGQLERIVGSARAKQLRERYPLMRKQLRKAYRHRAHHRRAHHRRAHHRRHHRRAHRAHERRVAKQLQQALRASRR